MRRWIRSKRRTLRPSAVSVLTSPPRRISVVGSTGSGKTTFARELARRLGVPCVELDALAWGPNWTLVPEDLFKQRVARAVEGDAWVIDGNYAGRRARDLVWPRADTLIWLDPPLGAIFVRLFRRAVRSQPKRRGAVAWHRQSRNSSKPVPLTRDAFLVGAQDVPAPQA